MLHNNILGSLALAAISNCHTRLSVTVTVTALIWGEQIRTNQMRCINAVRSLLLKYKHFLFPPFSHTSLCFWLFIGLGFFFSFYSIRSILSLMHGVVSRCVSLHVKMQNISCKCSKNVCENHREPHPAINSFF